MMLELQINEAFMLSNYKGLQKIRISKAQPQLFPINTRPFSIITQLSMTIHYATKFREKV